ncbi:cation transporter [Skermanella stibiiresistens SB22]|uniref:Cation transporter n=1 Tax=Skermanella stibiiresistens SB22 TaxID=1385369 RepID=W9H764_9PROT|nr:sodium:proton antiporter [Skermanella stibiiresistens]EWY42080.1 cation transporter [Skermanella stibiiresistens SB22]
MNPYIVFLTGLGVVILCIAWLPMLLRNAPLSLPIFCVLLGFGLFAAPGVGPDPNFIVQSNFIERITELVVIIALLGAGLKLDRPVGWRRWRTTWLLLAVTMPLSILGIALLGVWTLGLSLPGAILLGAVLAPTDPVLASDIQVGPPRSGGEDEVRFSLTSEAGLNDGLAFPFTNLAIALAAAAAAGGMAPGWWTVEWFALDVVWKLAAGLTVGWAVGRFLGFLVFRLPAEARIADTREGLAALGITLVSYGVTELVHGYGFLAVFVAAVTLRHTERSHDFNESLHTFSEQIEKLLMMVVLVLFGGAIAGGLLNALTWQAALAALAFLFLVRPIAGFIGLAATGLPLSEQSVIGFFGIRGIGSFYYLAYAVNHTELAEQQLLWSITGFVVAVSILVHGVTVTPVMNRLEARWRRRDPRSPGEGANPSGVSVRSPLHDQPGDEGEAREKRGARETNSL